jgi:hypothetical protein
MRARISLPLLALAVSAGAVLLSPAPLSAQRDDDDWAYQCERNDGWNSRRNRDERRWQHCEVRVTGFKAKGGVVTVDPGENGAVEIVGWDRDSVEIHARVQTYNRSEREAEDMAREVRVTTRGNSIGADGPGRRSGSSWSVSFLVYVPRKTDLTLETINGPIGVTDVSGVIRLTAENGPVSLKGVAGDVRARTQNGPLTITLDGVRWDGAGLDAAAENGPVSLRVPLDYNAQLEFGTVNGPMSVGFPVEVTLQGRLNKRITTKLGTGGATIRAVTTNGPFVLSRRG